MAGYGIVDQQGTTLKVPASRHSGLIPVHAVFITIAVCVYHWTMVSEKSGLSALLTLSAIFQCSAICLMLVGSLSTGSVEGISAKSLQLQALGIVCRLSSTTWLLGYIPFDRTGDALYEGFDFLSLALVLWLLRRVVTAKTDGIGADADDDDFPVAPVVVIALIWAGLFHANLDQRPIFDTLWMFGLFVGSLAMLPQLWLMMHGSATVPAGMNHAVVMTAVSCLSRAAFMWFAFADFTSKSYFTQFIKFNMSGYAALAAHAVHLMLLAGFCCVQLKHSTAQGNQLQEAPLAQQEV